MNTEETMIFVDELRNTFDKLSVIYFATKIAKFIVENDHAYDRMH